MTHRAFILFCLLSGPAAPAQRLTMPLDGAWQFAQSETAPASFAQETIVPGLAPVEGKAWLWFRRTFRAPERRDVARLVVRKAQFGTMVWLNGKPVGEHAGCFTAGRFDLGSAIRWNAENELLIRVGAHQGALPPSVPAGRDGEKRKWTPGIYDRVHLEFSNAPAIESVQVAPKIEPRQILVETMVRNAGPARKLTLTQRVDRWPPVSQAIAMGPGEERAIRQVVPLPDAGLWSPDDPRLYTLETSTGGDTVSTRFGLREFRFDTPTRRAYLNGKPIFLRGSNITLHRFFEDDKCGRLPWTERWVRGLLADIPRRMNWNAFRFCIGPVPDAWLDIADEAGLLIQNEYFIWGYRPEWSTPEVIAQFREWMRDNWNHPSVVIWDASNETRSDVLTREVIPAVRPLDLSNRPWENGYNPPDHADDPVENHPYENFYPGRPFELTDLETTAGAPLKMDGERTPATAHAMINNEYASFWLTREGAPTFKTKPKWDRMLPDASPAERLEYYAYLVGGLTEYWRAHRNFAGILHFVLLTASNPNLVTCDSFRDVERLELEPRFADYAREAFKPLGVYLRFWRPELTAGSRRAFEIMMVNDEAQAAAGVLSLTLGPASAQTRFSLGPYGAHTYVLELAVPAVGGRGELRAAALRDGIAEPTVSRRRVVVNP